MLLDDAAFLLHARDLEGWFLTRVDLGSGAVTTVGDPNRTSVSWEKDRPGSRPPSMARRPVLITLEQ